jgi:hypothetical protein
VNKKAAPVVVLTVSRTKTNFHPQEADEGKQKRAEKSNEGSTAASPTNCKYSNTDDSTIHGAYTLFKIHNFPGNF